MTTRSSRTSARSSTSWRSAYGTGATGGGKDFLAGYGVHSIALQMPKSQLDNGGNHTIGVWAATDRQKVERRQRQGGKAGCRSRASATR